jgi:hypothetical protein
MSIFTALSTFQNAPLEKDGKCTVCDQKHETGAVVLWKVYAGQFGKCRVILCDEKCHETYDWNYWESRRREKTRSGNHRVRRAGKV